MRVLVWIKIILFGTFAAFVFAAISLFIDSLIRPSRGLLFLDLTYVAYLIVSLVAAVSGAIVAIGVLISRSRAVSLIVAFVVAVTVSYGMIKGAIDIYNNENYFDAPMFYAGIVQIVLNLVIYPAVCLLIWKIFGKDLAVRT